MRAIIIIAPLAMHLLPGISVAQTNEQILADAQAAFREGIQNKGRLIQSRADFSKSADAYLELHRRDVHNPALYRNLGNAAALADRWPVAIWAYHVGLKLDPNDRAMREHLAFARSKVLYPAAGQGRPEADAWPVWLHRPTLLELGWLFGIGYALAWLTGTFAVATKTRAWMLLAFLTIQATILFGVWLTLEFARADADRQTPLVVVAENTALYRGNGPSYPQHASVPLLPRGLEGRIVHRRGEWLQVRLTSGEIGWLPRNQVLIVEP